MFVQLFMMPNALEIAHFAKTKQKWEKKNKNNNSNKVLNN